MRSHDTDPASTSEETELVRSACLTVAVTLGTYLGDVVIVGGLVPSLLIDSQRAEPTEADDDHPGTNDLDLGLSLAVLDDQRYTEISARLRAEGFEPDQNAAGNPTVQRWRLGELKVDFIVGTFSKALAGIGGYAVSRHSVLKHLHFAARPYVFSASGSPATIAGVHAALRILQTDTTLRARLWDNVRRVRAGLIRAGFTIGATESPIVPIVVGPAELTVAMWQTLLQEGVYANIVLPPACRADACLLRTSYSAAHSREEIDRAVSAFTRVGRALSIIDHTA